MGGPEPTGDGWLRAALDGMLDAFPILTPPRDPDGWVPTLAGTQLLSDADPWVARRYDVVMLLSASGLLTYVSPVSRDVLGYPPVALLGRSLYEVVEPDDVPAVRSLHLRALRDHQARVGEFRLLRGDGRPLWCEAVLRRVADSTGGMGLRMTLRDVSERPARAAALRETQEWFGATMAAMPDALTVWQAVRDSRGRLTDFRARYANPVACSALGVEVGHVVGGSLLDLLPFAGATGLFDALIEVTESGTGEFVPGTASRPFPVVVGAGASDSGVFDGRMVRLSDGVLLLWRGVD